MDHPDREVAALDPTALPDLASRLSHREREIITLISQGYNNLQIATELFIYVNTVKTDIRSAYRTIGVTSRSAAAVWESQNRKRLAELSVADMISDLQLGGPTERALWVVRSDDRSESWPTY
jgi:ATP/maltotriose-dependent transcriptional regulator MalT